MTLKAANIEQATPAKRGSRAGDFASDLAALGLHSSQHGFDGGRYGDAEGFASATFGAGESKDAIFQIHAIEWNLSFTEATASSQGDLKADSHPFGHAFNGQGFPGDFNLIVRKNGFNAGDRPALNSVIQKGDRIHFAQQSALAVDPLKNLQILAGLVPSSLAAGRAGKALTPLQINFTIMCRKRLQSFFIFDNKTQKMTPAISVINFCQCGNGVIFNQILNPVVSVIRSLFVHSNSGGLSRCLGAMQSIVRSVSSAFCMPLASWIFEPNKEPRTTLFNVGISQGDNGNIRLI